MPVETYKIQLEPIKSADADKSAKELAVNIAKLNNLIVSLSKALDRSVSIQKTAQKIGGADPRAIRGGTSAAKQIDTAVKDLNSHIKHLTADFKNLPKAITDAIRTSTETVRRTTTVERLPQADPEIKAFIRELFQLRKNIGKSETYQTGKKDVYAAVDKLIRELSAQKRDISKLADAVRGLSRASGSKESPRTGEVDKSKYKPTTDAKLFGKALRDMGGEFEKIKRELSDKIVVAVDLETSAFDKTLAKKLGKVAATEFITQIAYQKGTLAEIMSGKAKKAEIYVKPPKDIKTKEEYLQRLTKAAPTEDIAKKIKKGSIAFDKLNAEGKEATEAMAAVAEALKDAEAVIGHNIAKFDISVLEQHLERSGIKIDSAIDKFVDTVKLARHNFPERYGKNFEFGEYKPHGLEQLDKDFRLAGIEARSLAESMHDGAIDLKVNVALLKALDKSTEELAAVQSNASVMLKKLLEDMAAATQDAYKNLKSGTQKVAASCDSIEAVSKNLQEASKSIVKQAVGVENLARVKSALQTRIYKETVLRPKAEAGQYGIEGPAAGEVGDKILRIWGDLAKSLFDLQKNMVTSLEKGMNKGLEIWRDASGEAFKLGEGGREWEVRIADVRGLRRELSSTFREQAATGSTPGELVKAFKSAFVRRELATPADREDMASEVYKEIGSLTRESAAKMGDIVKGLYKGIQAKTTTEKDILSRGDIENLYKGVALEAQAERAVMENFVKSITVPAARVTEQGTLAFETKYGAEKALANFATITTGFEKLVKEMELLGAPAVEVSRMLQEVSKAPLRSQKGTPEAAQAGQLAEELQRRVLQLGGREKLKVGYQRAISLREMERGVPREKALKSVIDQGLDKIGLEDLIVKAKELNVTALDAAKALDEIKFENFYDMLDKLFQAGKTPLLEQRAGSIIKLGQSESSLRKIGSVISDVMGLMPMVEPGKPKRREYDEQSVKVLTKSFLSELRPEEQKQHIIDVGLLWKDLAVKAEKLGEGLFTGKEYLGKPVASSLDLSDAASSALKQFNLNFASNLQSLDKTMTSMSLSNIRALAPFQEFASIQRQQSYATSAISGGLVGGEEFKTPSLVSSKEKGLIESGRYGTGGYGLDVLTELRNTAATFEDQIVISGKLADAFTKITTRLVRPAATYLEQQRITEVSGGVQRMTPRAAKMRAESEGNFKEILSDVADQFQEILGVPERYRGRADIAEISDKIENIMREHRGRTVEVQTAKLTETFLNYFGRKLSTRFGTKGVSVTPEYGELPKDIGGIEDVAKFIKAGFKTGVATGPGLGVAKVPKSVGQMVSEIFKDIQKNTDLYDEASLSQLTKELVNSGNKFIIDLFTDASKGLVTDEEAKKQKLLFENVYIYFKRGLDKSLPAGAPGIKRIQQEYKEQFGGRREPFEMKPIEARISSRGIAKRGLMPEILEGLVNNLIGSTAGTTTLVDKIGKDALTETKAARERLNEYLEALGFEAFKDLDKVIANLRIPKAEAIKSKKWESQWKVYTEVVDEFGKKMQSFVSPKFLQIIEEPTRYKEWSSEEIGKGVKGAKLDFQSFAAMAGVFGEGSSMMKELAASTSLTSKEGWELLRTFQMLDPAMKDFKNTMMKALPTVKLEDLAGFSDATGTVEDFKDTIFDIGKYPTPFKLRLPTAKGEYEEMPMPGASLRTTYREQLLGRGAPTNVARYLANLVDSAKAVEDLTAAASRGGMGLDEAMRRKFAATIRTELTTMLTNAIKEFRGFESGGALTPQNIKDMQETIDKFKGALSAERTAPGVYQEGLGRSELEAVEAYETKAKGQHKFSSIMSRISDILIGVKPESLVDDMKNITESLKIFRESGQLPLKFEGHTPEAFQNAMSAYTERNRLRGEAKKVFDIELEAGNLDEFAQKVGIDISESVKQALQKKLESLSRAKISYFRELGAEVFGKKKGIEQTFFQRVTPAVTGKAISAITDKTKELTALLNTLRGAKYDLDLDIPGIDKLIKNTKELTREHKNYIDKAKKLGLPVLREGEIAIPESQAAKIKVRTGKEDEVETNLAELIKKQEKIFVESIRFPFTGTLSVQPHEAKLMERDLGKQSIAVPGAPQLDMGKLNEVIGTLREYIGVTPKKEGDNTLSLLQQREQAWAEGTEKGAKKANALTSTIEGLIKVINDATPKFVNLEQKLDFDGDTLFVHTGQLEESRKEIGMHFKALGEDVTSVRNLFRSLFTAVSEGDVSTLVEMKQEFEKKHEREKGFDFLTKPYIREGMAGLDLDDVMGALFKYKPEAKNMEKGTAKWQTAVSEWSKGFVVNDILPEVFTRLGVTSAERELYTGRVAGSKTGIPEVTSTSSKLDSRISGLADELVRRQLWEKRYSDAITGQLYKLHTGRTVEGVSRIARVSEIETGFGKGLAGTGKGVQPSAEFLKAFPKESVALGGRPVQEFATRVNEIMRFVIQKGMDVKHVGVEAVGQKIIANVGKTTGAETIMRAMDESVKQFEELASFNEQISNEVRLRLGAVSTGELQKELRRFEPETDIADLDINRQEIIQRIIKHVDLQAVFEELFRQIKRAAVKGLTKSLQEKVTTLPAGSQKVKLMREIEAVGTPARLAEEKITKESREKGGISLFKHITTTLQPLYRMRTSMETMGTAAQRAGIKVEPTSMVLPAGQPGKDIAKQFEMAAKAANALSKAMESSVATPGRGIHTSMVVGALKQRYKDLEELQKLEQGAQKYAGRFEYAFTDVMDANKLAAKVWSESKELAGMKAPSLMPADYDVTGWLDQLNAVKKIASRKLEEISEKAGLPPMVPEEKSLLAAGFESKFGARTFKTLKDVMGKGMIAREEKIVPEDLESKAKDAYQRILEFVKFQVSFVEQLRRVSEISKTVPTQKLYLREAFPDFDPVAEFKPAFEGLSNASTEFIDKEKAVANLLGEYYKEQTTTRLSDIQEAIKTTAAPATGVAAEDLKKEVVKAADELTEAITRTVVERKRDALKYLESKAEGPKPVRGALGVRTEPLFKMFRASGVQAGGGYGGGTQQESIMKEMLGIRDPSMLLESTGFRGQAIHRKIQKEFVGKYPGAEIEQLMEDFENKITGHFDILYEKSGQKILTDIKTVYSTRQFERLREISDEIGKRNITIQQKLEELKVSEPTSDVEKNVIRRLENYISQVNIYLKNTEDAVGELLIASTFDPEDRVTIPIGKFDPKLFSKDIEVVNRSKAKVIEILKSISATGGLPEGLLKEYPKIYKALSKQLEQGGVEEFKKALPVQTLPMNIGKVGRIGASAQEVLGRLTENQQEQFERLSSEYLAIFKELGGPGIGGAEKFYKLWFAGGAGAGAAGAPPAAPPPPPPTGPGGGGFDDDEEFRKKIEELLARIQSGIEPDVSEIDKLVRAVREADDRAAAALQRNEKGDEQLAAALSDLAVRIREAIERVGGKKSAETISKLYDTINKVKMTDTPRGGADFASFRTADIERIQPDRPEAIHKNLIALYEAAIRVNRLADSEDIQKFGPDIAGLLMEVAEKGPAGISPQISEAISKLSPAKKGGMAKIWMLYKKAVSEYFLRRLDNLKKEIEKEAGTSEGRQAYAEYEQVLEKYLANIRGTIGRTSDIFTTRGATGKKTQFVDTELARLTGIYKTPKQIEETVKQSNLLSGEFQPIMDVLVGDLDPTLIEDMISPLEKVRMAFQMLTKEDAGMRAILEDADKFRRIGHEAVKAWDFDKLIKGITQLRGGLQAYNRLQIGGFGGLGEDYTEQIRKNVEDTIGYLKQLEKMFATAGGPGVSPLGLTAVPPFLDPKTQAVLHKRNIAQVQEYFATPQEAGGPEKGQAFTYRYKVVDPSTKQALSSVAEEFRKVGEESTRTGKRIGLFTQSTDDLVKSFQGKRGIGQAFSRVLRWGFASRTVYGIISALQNMVSTISDVEMGIAVLRQVMSPLQTDFEGIQQSAVDFAKQFGLPIRQVVDSMRVFAQQGLAQQEVIDRTRTSMLAANTTTLTAGDATEAITAAMKVYGKEGQSTLRFLDSWTQVEARHAITSMDLANALKKAAAAAKTSGVDFDQLNAIVTGIGETSRQTGKEIGTSLRFMFRRLQGEKGPKELGKIGIPVVSEMGDIRPGFEILGDLAGRWGDMNKAQQLSIAQAIGGRRHYNSLIILMDHWDDVMATLTDSINSKGAAERRNAIVMETYAKRLQQVRAALNDVQLQFGKFALPVAKTFLTGIRFFLEAIANVPNSVKIATIAIGGLFAALAKGDNFIKSFVTRFKTLPGIITDAGSAVNKEFKVGMFEVFGKKLGGTDFTGLKTITEAMRIEEIDSTVGKFGFLMAKAGRYWNDFLSDISGGASVTFESLSGFMNRMGTIAGVSAVGAGHPAIAASLKGVSKAMAAPSFAFKELSKYTGVGAEVFAKWSQGSTGFVKSVGPMAGSLLALIPILKKSWQEILKVTVTASTFEKSLDGTKRKLTSELAEVNNLRTGYEKLSGTLGDIQELRKPDEKAKRLRREEYESPLLKSADLYEQSVNYANQLAQANSSLVVGYDEFGNAIVSVNSNLKDHLNLLASMKTEEVAKVDVGAAEKYISELTDKGFGETFKLQLKSFLKEVPAIGELFAEHIKVSPAKEMDVLVKKMNRLLAVRAEAPLAPIGPKLQQYNKELERLKETYSEYYKSFKRVIADITSEGLDPAIIKRLLDTPEIRKGFELMLKIEPKFQVEGVKGKFTPEDILGSEILKRMHPKKPLDLAAPLTKELLLTSKILPRKGKAFAEDIVLFTQDLPKEFNIAGRQAVLKFREGVGWFVNAVSRELDEVEIPYSSVRNFIDGVFPAQEISDRLQENLEVLKESIAGAVAGFRGITATDFKREFNLGPRFFSDIPTTTLLQTEKGYDPITKAFGEVDFQKDWSRQMDDLWFKPMKQLTGLIEAASGRAVAGAEEAPGGGISPALREEIENLQRQLKNNQVMLQYRSVLVDLHKQLEENVRATEISIAAERVRNNFLRQTAGLLAGLPDDLAEVNLGIQKYSDLTSQQRLLFREAGQENQPFTQARGRIRELDVRRRALATRAEAVERAKVELGLLRKMFKETDVSMDPKDLKQFVETVAVTGSTDVALLLGPARKTADFTGRSAETLDQMLAEMSSGSMGFGKLSKGLNVAVRSAISGGPQSITKQLFSLGRVRERFAGKGQIASVGAVDSAMNELVMALLDGSTDIDSAMRMVREAEGSFFKRAIFTPSFSEEDLVKRAVGTQGLKEFIAKLDTTVTKLSAAGQTSFFENIGISKNKWKSFVESKELSKLRDISEDTSINTGSGAKNTIKLFAGYGALNDILRRSSKRQVSQADVQIGLLRNQRKSLVEEFKAGNISRDDFAEKATEINKQISSAVGVRGAAEAIAKKRATQEAVGLIGAASLEFANAVGISDKAIKILGGTVASALVGWYAWSKLSGEPIPDYIRQVGEKAKEAAKDLGKSKFGDVSFFVKSKFGKAFGTGLGGAVKEAEKKIKESRVLSAEERKAVIAASFKEASAEQVQQTDELLKQVESQDKKQSSMGQKMLNEASKQTDVLLGIYDNTRPGKEGADPTDNLRDTIKSEAAKQRKELADYSKQLKIRVGIIGKERVADRGIKDIIRDILTPLVLVGAAGTLYEKGAERKEAGRLKGLGEKAGDIVDKLYEKHPEVIKDVIGLLQSERKNREAFAKKEGSTEKEKKLTAAFTEQTFAEVANQLAYYSDALKLGKKVSKDSAFGLKDVERAMSKENYIAAIQNMSEKFNKEFEDFASTFVKAISGFLADLRFRTAPGGALKGLGRYPEIELGKTEAELTPTERLFRTASKDNKNLERLMITYQALLNFRDAEVERLKSLAGEVQDFGVTALMSAKKTKELTSAYKEAAKEAVPYEDIISARESAVPQIILGKTAAGRKLPERVRTGTHYDYSKQYVEGFEPGWGRRLKEKEGTLPHAMRGFLDWVDIQAGKMEAVVTETSTFVYPKAAARNIRVLMQERKELMDKAYKYTEEDLREQLRLIDEMIEQSRRDIAYMPPVKLKHVEPKKLSDDLELMAGVTIKEIRGIIPEIGDAMMVMPDSFAASVGDLEQGVENRAKGFREALQRSLAKAKTVESGLERIGYITAPLIPLAKGFEAIEDALRKSIGPVGALEKKIVSTKVGERIAGLFYALEDIAIIADTGEDISRLKPRKGRKHVGEDFMQGLSEGMAKTPILSLLTVPFRAIEYLIGKRYRPRREEAPRLEADASKEKLVADEKGLIVARQATDAAKASATAHEDLKTKTIESARATNEAKAATDLYSQRMQNEIEMLDRLNQTIEEITTTLSRGIGLSEFAGEIERLRNSLSIEELSDFNKEFLDKMLGGAHPLARVLPSYEAAVGAKRLGIEPGELTGLDRFRASELEARGRGQRITAEFMARQQYGRGRAQTEYDQREQQRLFMRQFNAVQEMLGAAGRGRQAALGRGLPEGFIAEFDAYIEQLREVLHKAPEAIPVEQFKEEARGQIEITKTQLERAKAEGRSTDEVRLLEKGLKVLNTQIAEAPDVGKMYRGVFNVPQRMEAGLYGKLGELEGLKAEDIYGPLINSFDSGTEAIVSSVMASAQLISSAVHESSKFFGKDFNQADFAKKFVESLDTFNRSLRESAAENLRIKAVAQTTVSDIRGKQLGGTIIGPGGPKDDRVPIMASPGEFVVKASSAQSLGAPALNYMNQTGSVPGFAEGGFPFGKASDVMGESAQFYTEKRLKLAKKNVDLLFKKDKSLVDYITLPVKAGFNVAKMVGVAGAEIGLKYGRIIPEIFSMVESASELQAKGKLGETIKGLASSSFLSAEGMDNEQYKSMFSGLWKYLKEDLSKGGTNITAGLLDIFTPGGLMGKAKKAIKVASKSKPITKATVTGKYADEITKMVMDTERGVIGVGNALGVRAIDDPKILGTMVNLRKRLSNDYKKAMDEGNFDKASSFGTKVQALKEAAGVHKVMLAAKQGKAIPDISVTKKALQYMEEGGTSSLPILDLPSIKRTQKVTSPAKYEDKIMENIRRAETNTDVGYALGNEAVYNDKLFKTMSDMHMTLRSKYDKAMLVDPKEAITIGGDMQALSEGLQFRDAVKAIKQGKTPPSNSATTAALRHVEKNDLNLPKLDLPSRSKFMGMLAEETGLGPPGGIFQMGAEIAGAVVKKPKGRIFETFKKEIRKNLESTEATKYAEINKLLYGRYADEGRSVWNFQIYKEIFEKDVIDVDEVMSLLKKREKSLVSRKAKIKAGEPFNKRFPAGKRESPDVSYAEIAKLDPDEYIKVNHGGTLEYVKDFLAGRKKGYELERGGFGLQVSPLEQGIAGRVSDYAQRAVGKRFGTPAKLNFEIQRKYLSSANNIYEAGFKPEFRKYMKNIKLENLTTGVVESPKLDLPPMKKKSKFMGMLSEETGLGPPGGALQMVMESAAAAVKKPKKLAFLGPLEMESYVKKPMKGVPEGAFETILERKAKSSQDEIELIRRKWHISKGESFETILERRELAKLEEAIKVVGDVTEGSGRHLHTTARELLYGPRKMGILKEIPKGARAIRGEAEVGSTAIVLDLPGNKVMRIGDKLKPRLNIPEMLQVESRKVFGEYQVEVVPRAGGIGTATMKQTRALRDDIKARGVSVGKEYDFWDIHADNIGFVDKKPIVIDPGSIDYRKGGAIIGSYSQGTPYVPQTQLAMVHQGEAIIPAEYNMGGFVGAPRFQAGGAVNPLKVVEDTGKKIGEAIAKKIEDTEVKLSTTEVTAKLDQAAVALDVSGMEELVERMENVSVDFNIPTAEELPKLEIGNLDDVRIALENGVGAERGQSKLDQFIGKVDDELRRFDEEIVSTSEKVTVLETSSNFVDNDIREIKLSVDENTIKVQDIYTKTENMVDEANYHSYLEKRLQELYTDITTGDLVQVKADLSRLQLTMNTMKYDMLNQHDIMMSNINRLDLKGI